MSTIPINFDIDYYQFRKSYKMLGNRMKKNIQRNKKTIQYSQSANNMGS